MQFSIQTVLAVAISMATLASAAPQAMDLAVGDTTLAGDNVLAEGDPNDKGIYSCCAFKDCTVCAEYGHINDCSPCGGVSSTSSQVHVRIQKLILGRSSRKDLPLVLPPLGTRRDRDPNSSHIGRQGAGRAVFGVDSEEPRQFEHLLYYYSDRFC